MKTIINNRLKYRVFTDEHGELYVCYTKIGNEWKPTLTVHQSAIPLIKKDGSNLPAYLTSFKKITEYELSVVNGGK